ncbi:outer membrane beta-barrel protein [Planktotalea sp.]|uniref:outer membrane beta-barrel protein n=1 Tax=Planktotalea sp. TaxID=2029877 RepID=UPI0025E3286D|nr:outer membrane beta-barrel protein [Planktotalea sp.]
MHRLLTLLASLSFAFSAQTGAAELELSFYGGTQSSPHSRVSGTYPGTGTNYNALIGWEGKSLAPPPYYGARATWWKRPDLGFGIELTHAKVYAPVAERNAIGFNRLEFTDGHNILTFNVTKRWNDRFGPLTPYAGVGVGFAMPHVDVTSANGHRAFGYQITGPAARLTAGMKYDLTDRWALFGEYQFTYSSNKAKLPAGGTLNTGIITNAINFGISYSF